MAKKILVIDDETDFSEMLQFRLRHLNYEVSAAANGVDALTMADQKKPDVIVLDLLLPDLDGLTLCGILRRQVPTRATPIIMLTAVSNEATRHAARIAGASAFLCKPLDFDQLRAQLEMLLARQPLIYTRPDLRPDSVAGQRTPSGC